VAFRSFTWIRRLAGLAALVALAGPGVSAQNATAPELKAAFLYNFAKFTEWPELEPDAGITLCVVDDDRVAAALATTVKGQSLEAHRLRVLKVDASASFRICQILFVAGPNAARAAKIVERAAGLPVLTASDASTFSTSGGMIEFFVESGRMRFAVNVDAIQRVHVRLSSRLLGLAKIVRETANVP
jgi:hypothetical protein